MASKQGIITTIIYYYHYYASVHFYFILGNWLRYREKTLVFEDTQHRTGKVQQLQNQQLTWTSPIAITTFIFDFRSADLTPAASELVLLILFVGWKDLFAANFLQDLVHPARQIFL